jgi:hypothetical protein
MSSALTYQFIESSFIKNIQLIDQLSVENILDKLKKVNVLCNNNKSDLSLVYFAYYDLYITQLKNLNYKFNGDIDIDIDIDNDKIDINIKKIREVNQYAKLVEILVESKPNIFKSYVIKKESENNDVNESPKKKQKNEEPVRLENPVRVENPVRLENPNEKEWANWIVKNKHFADNFNPNNFLYCLNNLDLMVNYKKP